MDRVEKYLKEMYTILDEIVNVKDNLRSVVKEVEKLDEKYLDRQFDYNTYIKIRKSILGNKNKDVVLKNYDIYLGTLKNRLKELNSKVLKIVHADKTYDDLRIGKASFKRINTHLPSIDALEIGEIHVEKKLVEKKVIKQEIKKVVEKKEPLIDAPLPRSLEHIKTPPPVKLGFLKRIVYAFQAKEKPWLDTLDDNARFAGIFSPAFLRYILLGDSKRDTSKDLFGETHVLPSVMSYDAKQKSTGFNLTKSDILDPYLLEKEIKELKSLISEKKPEIYKASTLGYLSNLFVRKVSIYFIEHYPGVFKKLYMAIRYANMKVLANTYINIMFFITLIALIIILPLSIFFFLFQGNTILMVMVKSFFTTFGLGNLVFWGAFYYPFMQAKTRRRSINTNLPFAIDHMSSVIASGVNPSVMFKLISHSKEYGEISIEIEKVTNYIDFFGYDILTALKAVALTTPSDDFKEFIEGFVSTIETGGDLRDYLKQKSEEALLNYRLERQKYVESIGTYSDIYTGVLIAAPLFFVTALSLVSVLGGRMGGFKINTIITLGTYVVIPLLNMLFIVFLELNQPEI